jgi:hypothetical protein
MEKSKYDLIKKEIDLPKFLHDLHSERTRVSTLIVVYLSALICAGVAAWQIAATGQPVWKTIFGAFIFMDIGGGVVANLSSSTNRYYQKRLKLRLPFLALHVIHPAALALLFPSEIGYFIVAGAVSLTSAFIVNAVKDGELQQNLAALLVAAGCAFSFCFRLDLPILYLFAPLFLVKLVLGFAVRRPNNQNSQG